MLQAAYRALHSVNDWFNTPLPAYSQRQRETWLQPLSFNATANDWRPNAHGGGSGTGTGTSVQQELSKRLRIISWNVDLAMPEDVPERLRAVLALLRRWVDGQEEEAQPVVVCLQETHRSARQALLDDPWIRQTFTLVGRDDQRYDVLTLVSRNTCGLDVRAAWTIDLPKSFMGRRALFVDIHIELSQHQQGRGGGVLLLRVGNTHLESLNAVHVREAQLTAAAAYITLPPGKLALGMLCGDLNANSPGDAFLPEKSGLEDAWLLPRSGIAGREGQQGGGEGQGYTWGFKQREGESWPEARMDKILVAPAGSRMDGVQLGRVEVLEARGERGEWVSDHHALLMTVQLGA